MFIRVCKARLLLLGLHMMMMMMMMMMYLSDGLSVDGQLIDLITTTVMKGLTCLLHGSGRLV